MLREGAKLRLTRRRLPAGRHQRPGDHRLQRELVARAQRPAHALRPRAQPALRRAARALPRLERRARLPDRAADRLGADREDPHGRVDAGDPRHQGHRRRPEDQLERPARPRLADPARHLADRQPRRPSGIPKTHARPPRRAVLADRGLRHRLPDASAAARRLPLRRPPNGRAARPARLPRHPGRRRPTTSCAGSACDNTLYSFGIAHPGAITLHNYPRVAAEVRARRRDHRPVGRRPRAHPPARRAPLQRLPRRACTSRGSRSWEELSANPESVRRLREVYRSIDEVDTMVGLFAETPPDGLRLLRHGVPDLHPDGVAPAAERPLPHRRLPARDLLAVRHGLGREQRHDQRHPAPLPGARRRAAARRERVRAVAARRRRPRRSQSSRREDRP